MKTNRDIFGNEINKYLYKIICQNGNFAMGIFCRILDELNRELAITLITSKNANITNKNVRIISNNNTIPLEIVDDFDKNELKIIEINQNQELRNIEFINIEYYSMLESCRKNEFNDKQVYLLDLHVGNEIKYNAGIIQDINDETNKIEFLCFQKGKTPGGFIICTENNKDQLLGIYESPEDKKYWKDGTFICEYVKTYYEKNDCTSFQLNRNLSQRNKEKQNNKKNNDIKNININKVNNSNKQSNKNNNNVNINNNNINNQYNQNINNNNMNYQYNQNINNNNMNYPNNQNINNNMNYQNNQNLNNNVNYQNNQNLNNNNLNYQNNQNIINANLNNQMDIEYNQNNQIINNMNAQKMDIEYNTTNYQNNQNINNNMNNQNLNNLNNNNVNNQNLNNLNNNMNNQNNNINQNKNNQFINNMNNQYNNSLGNQNNNNMNCQNFNNVNNQPNNYTNNINQFNQSINIIEQENYVNRRNNTCKDPHHNYNLDSQYIPYNNNQNMNAQNINPINKIDINNMKMNYQGPNNFNMNIQNLSQMNKFTQNTNNYVPKMMNQIYGINYEDIYPYIKENKINISFKNKNNEIKNVSIPSSLRNIELYYTANKINNPDFFEYSDFNLIKLYLNNQLISNNDDPITNIVFNGAQIFIMETNKDLSYYDSINQNSQNINKMTIYFNNNSEGKKYIMIFPFNTKPKDILLSFFAKYKIPEDNRKYFTFTFGVDLINLNDEKTLNNVRITQGCNINFTAYDINISDDIKYSKKDIPGKKLKISLLNKNDELIGEIYAGSLQQIKSFYKILLNYLHRKKIEFTLKPVILISGVETILNESNERTFSSYGILNDFKCKVDGVKNEK